MPTTARKKISVGEGRGEKKLRTRKPMARGLNHLTITAPQHAALRETLRQILLHADRVVLVGPMPRWPWVSRFWMTTRDPSQWFA